MNPQIPSVKKQTYNLITLLGPTATGKTKLSAQLAYHFSGEVISADSRQVYRRMDIGTGKDLNDYIVDGNSISYHLIDIIEPKDEFNLYSFIEQFNIAFNDIARKKKLPFLVGGTGLYLSAILQKYQLKKADFVFAKKFETYSLDELKKKLINLNPKLHNTTDLIDKERIIKAIIIEQSNIEEKLQAEQIKSFNIGILLEREEIKKRITARLKKRLSEGMIEEVATLMKDGISCWSLQDLHDSETGLRTIYPEG